nr:retrovirus-related Pol polyprotein from transposon TNT 1-94 [Tanacetum cinerariifolium]
DFQDSPDDEEDTKSSHEYLNDLEEEYQARSLLSKYKRFIKKGTQRFSSAKAIDQTQCHKCGKKGHFARDCLSKTLVFTYQSPFQPKHLTSMVKNKCLIVEAYEWDEEEVSSDDNEMVEVNVLMALAEENDVFSKVDLFKQIPSQKKRILGVDQLIEDPSSSGLKDLVFVKSSANDTKVTIPGVERPWLSKAKVAVTNSSATDYDSADESSVCSIPLPRLKKLDGVEPISGPKIIK